MRRGSGRPIANRVKKIENGETIVYIGKYYEQNLTTETETLYYFLGNKLVAYQVIVDATVSAGMYYVHQDHLGSTTIVTDANGDAVFERSYDPWGNIRTESGTADTDRLFTGQRYDAATGLYYYYNARYGACPEGRRRDPTIARFISPDTILPRIADPQAWNRQACSRYTPTRVELHCGPPSTPTAPSAVPPSSPIVEASPGNAKPQVSITQRGCNRMRSIQQRFQPLMSAKASVRSESPAASPCTIAHRRWMLAFRWRFFAHQRGRIGV